MLHGLPKVIQVVGESTGDELKTLMKDRVEIIEHGLNVMRLQYPDYARDLQARYLGQVALRIQETDYQEMYSNALISKEIFNDVEIEFSAKAGAANCRPSLDLGLDPEMLFVQVPFFADLPATRLTQIARLLNRRRRCLGKK